MSKTMVRKTKTSVRLVAHARKLVQSRKEKNNIRLDRKEVVRRMNYAMSVKELISELSMFPDDCKVVFAMDSRPCGKDEVAGPNGEYQRFTEIMLPGGVDSMDSDIEEIAFYKKKSGRKIKHLCIVHNRDEREDYKDTLEDDVVIITV